MPEVNVKFYCPVCTKIFWREMPKDIPVVKLNSKILQTLRPNINTPKDTPVLKLLKDTPTVKLVGIGKGSDEEVFLMKCEATPGCPGYAYGLESLWR